MPSNQLTVLVPHRSTGAVSTLNKTNPALGQSSGQEALPPEIARLWSINTIQSFCCVRLFVDTQDVRSLGLHAEGKFEGLDTSLEIGVVSSADRMLAIDLLQHFQFIT